MKKIILSLLMGVMLLGGAATFATDVQARGPVYEPTTRTGSKDIKSGSVRLYTLMHSAHFIPDSLGVSCQIFPHDIGAKNVHKDLDGAVVLSKNKEDNGFIAVARGKASYKKKMRTDYHRLYY